MERLFGLAFPDALTTKSIPERNTPLIEPRVITPDNLPELLQDRYDVYMTPGENVINAIKGKFFPTDFPLFLDRFTFSLPEEEIALVNTPIIPANVTLRTDNKIVSGVLAIGQGQITLAGKSVVYLCGSDATAIVNKAEGTVMEVAEGSTTVINVDGAKVFSCATIHDNICMLRSQATLGDLKAMYTYGTMGVSKLFPTLCNVDSAIKCLEFTARHNDIKSMCLLGSLYFIGEQLEQNLHIAAGYFHEAHLKGNLHATFMLGEIYSSPTFANCQINMTKGFQSGAAIGCEYYQEAAAKNHPEASEKVNEYNSRLFNFNVYGRTKI